jgi:acetyl esterase/lipase
VYDANDAVKYIVKHAKKFGIDPHKIIISGGSAGGHLALESAFRLRGEVRNFNPIALVLFNPVINTGPDGYGYRRLRDTYRLIDPMEHIPVNPPPAILFYGTRDQFIPEKQAKHFCHLYEAQGGVCSLKFYKGQRHGFWNYRRKTQKYFIETVRQADLFLIKQGILSGKPDVKQWVQGYDQ